MENGQNKEVINIRVEWENGTQGCLLLIAQIEQEMCINFVQLYLRNR